MPKDVILTPEGLQKLKEELDLLSTERRREVAERIKEAREFGDISENSEYDDAKNEQAMLESRIAGLQEKLRLATVIQTKELSTDVLISQATYERAKDACVVQPAGEIYVKGRQQPVVIYTLTGLREAVVSEREPAAAK